MPILLYCVANREVQVGNSLAGVAGVSVDRTENDGVALFAARNPDAKIWLARDLRTSAVEFHRVLTQMFQSGAIIPFRFPTILETEDQLMQHLRQKSSEYMALLEKFADLVQMEIRVTADVPAAAGSGTEYLKRRQNLAAAIDHLVDRLKAALGPLSKDWRQQRSKQGVRVFALVARGDLVPFENSIRTIDTPNDLQVRVSGPWPATEFMEQR